uniref:Uncharacterized protein n=1 Tax=mine drainage metagenome TaxID=410659 RepID=E6QBU5_9ZZZZ
MTLLDCLVAGRFFAFRPGDSPDPNAGPEIYGIKLALIPQSGRKAFSSLGGRYADRCGL